MNTIKKLLFIVVILLLIAGGFIYKGLLSLNKSQIKATVISQLNQTASPNATVLGTENKPIQEDLVRVVEVVDGDTIKVNSNGHVQSVRMIGINTPETVDPRRPVQCFGKEASNKTKQLLSGKSVVLKKDVSETDKFGRLLRFVYLPYDQGTVLFVNDYLVREGYAYQDPYPPDISLSEQFKQAEIEARSRKKGLWTACPINN